MTDTVMSRDPQVTGSDPEWTGDEMMIVAAARALRDGTRCFVGIGRPSTAANLARGTHAPNLVLIYESGAIGAKPATLPLSIGDSVLAESADSVVSVPEIFNYWLQPGRIDVGFLGAAQIDRYGNINTTVIGDDYRRPRVRLPGAGGAPEIAASCREVVVVLRHTPRALVERVDFLTSVGHGRPPDDRLRLGLPGKGPVLVVTDLGVLEPDPDTAELVLTQVHPGVDPDEVRAATGWPLGVASPLRTTDPPTVAELTALRSLTGAARRARLAGLTVPGYRRDDVDVHPPLLSPGYCSTVLRAPSRQFVPLPHGLTEITGPLLGEGRVTEADADLTAHPDGQPHGQRIVVHGRVMDGDGRPVPHTLIEIWQANAAGRYLHKGDRHAAPLDPHFTGVGRTLTDGDGHFRFITIRPGAYPWGNHENAWRPAHIHFSLFGTAFTQRLVTQMYFPDDPMFPHDPIFNSVRDPAARQRMISQFDLAATVPGWALGFQFDIVLRGREATPWEAP